MTMWELAYWSVASSRRAAQCWNPIANWRARRGPSSVFLNPGILRARGCNALCAGRCFRDWDETLTSEYWFYEEGTGHRDQGGNRSVDCRLGTTDYGPRIKPSARGYWFANGYELRASSYHKSWHKFKEKGASGKSGRN